MRTIWTWILAHLYGWPKACKHIQVWNTDGRRDISAGNARAIVDGIRASGREYIIWSAELADCPRGIPGGYL